MQRRANMAEATDVLFVPESIVAGMRRAVEAALPEEACGLLFGRGQRVDRAAAIENELHSRLRFRLEPRAQLSAMQSAEDDGLELLGIYHSHPEGPAQPSATDLQEAAYPEAAYLIWWRSSSGSWQCSLYWLHGLEHPAGKGRFTRGSLRADLQSDAGNA